MNYTNRTYYQGKLVAQMFRNGTYLRYKLIKIDRKYLDRKWQVKKSYPFSDPEIVNAQIDETEKVVNDIIKEILSINPFAQITNSTIDNAIRDRVNNRKEEVEVLKHILVKDFKEYVDERQKKRKNLQITQAKYGKIHRDYDIYKNDKSALHALQDFEHHCGFILYKEDLNLNLISDFIEFLAGGREESPDYKYKTKGELQNTTINKRLDSIATFIRHYYKDEDLAKRIIACHVEKIKRTEVIRLTKDELEMFSQLPVHEKWEERIRDYFTFLALTGLRFSDLISLRKWHFSKGEDVTTICLKTHKTKKQASIPLTKRALALAEKYEYRFDYYTNQAFNRELKNLLEKYDLFNDEIAYERISIKNPETVIKKRRDKISAHTARRTFVSILIETGTPTQIVMGMTGHTRIDTLQIYIDRFSPLSVSAINNLEF